MPVTSLLAAYKHYLSPVPTDQDLEALRECHGTHNVSIYWRSQYIDSDALSAHLTRHGRRGLLGYGPGRRMAARGRVGETCSCLLALV